MHRAEPATFALAALLCCVGAAVAWMAQGDQITFWRGVWIGTRWAYVVGASVFLICAVFRL